MGWATRLGVVEIGELAVLGGLLATVALFVALWLLLRRRRSRPSSDEDLGEFWDWVDLELERARRHERPMSLLSFAASQREGTLAADPGWAEHLRATDHVVRVASRTYLLAPDTDREGAESLVARLQAANLLLNPARIACFPQDALTRGSLIRHIRHSQPGARPVSTQFRRGA